MREFIIYEKYTFFSVIYPERAWVNIPPFDGPIFTSGDVNIGNIHIVVAYSQITIIADIINDDTDIFTIRNSIQSYINHTICVLDYAKGQFHTLDIKQYMTSSGEIFNFGANDFAVSARLSTVKNTIDRLFQITKGEKGLIIRQCFFDLTKAIQFPEDTGFYCYRAIESLLQYFDAATNKKQAWESLRQATNTTREEIDKIKNVSDQNRHGIHNDLLGDIRKEIIVLAYKITYNFINYLCTCNNEDPILQRTDSLQQSK